MTLAGNLVRLRSVEPSDYALLAEWYNNSEVMRYWGLPGYTVSIAEVARREEEQAARQNSRKYIVETLESRAIGQIDYYELDWRVRSASVSIMIAEPDFWGGGFGTDAMHTLLRYLFRQLGLHRVSLNVHESNERARHSYAKNGFREEGVMRDWAFFDGHWENGILMSVLESEFPESV
jgi:RimJ/RimL family protein N-acetyltransferase